MKLLLSLDKSFLNPWSTSGSYFWNGWSIPNIILISPSPVRINDFLDFRIRSNDELGARIVGIYILFSVRSYSYLASSRILFVRYTMSDSLCFHRECFDK